jgi:hypothetical protein
MSNYDASKYLDLSVENDEFRRKAIVYSSCLAVLLLVYSLACYHMNSYSLHIAFFIPFIVLLYALASLVQRESLKIVKGMGAFHEKQTLFSRKSLFIPYENISNIVVNEVLSFVSNFCLPQLLNCVANLAPSLSFAESGELCCSDLV